MWPFADDPVVDEAFGDVAARQLRLDMGRGNWAPARDFLATIDDPDDRAFYVQAASHVEGVDDWIDDWIDADPRATAAHPDPRRPRGAQPATRVRRELPRRGHRTRPRRPHPVDVPGAHRPGPAGRHRRDRDAGSGRRSPGTAGTGWPTSTCSSSSAPSGAARSPRCTVSPRGYCADMPAGNPLGALTAVAYVEHWLEIPDGRKPRTSGSPTSSMTCGRPPTGRCGTPSTPSSPAGPPRTTCSRWRSRWPATGGRPGSSSTSSATSSPNGRGPTSATPAGGSPPPAKRPTAGSERNSSSGALTRSTAHAQAAQVGDEVRVAAVDVVHVRRPRSRPSAHRPAMTRPAPARMSVARTGAPDSRSRPRTTAWWPSVRMSAPSRTISFTNMNRPSKMFSVISEAPSLTAARPIAIGSRSVAKPGNGSVTMSTAVGRSVHPYPERCRPASRPRPPAVTSLSSAISRKRRVDAVHGDVAAGHRRARTPRCRRRSGRRRWRGATGRSASTPSIAQRRRAGAVDLGAHRGEHLADVDDLRLAGRVVDLRDALGQHGRHQQVLGGADAREVQPDRRAAQPARRGGDDEAVLAGDLGAHPGQAGDVHVQAARADRVAARVGHPHVPAAGQQRPEHADRRAQPADQVVVGLGARLLGHVDDSTPSSAVERRPSQPSRRSTSAMIAMSVIRGTLVITRAARRQQRGRHQLERGVLRADHGDLAGQPGAALDPDHIHAGHRRVRRRAPRCSVARRCAMAVHLTRIYTKTGDAGTTRLGNNERVAKTDPRIAAYADVDECNAAIGVALALGDLADDLRGVLTARAERPVRRRRRPVQPDRAPDPPYPPLRVTEEYVTRLEGWCDEFNARLSKLDSFILPGGTAGRGAAARGPHGRPARRALGLGADRGRPRPHQRRCPAKYLNRLSDLLFILARAANPGRRREVGPGRRARDRLHHVELWVAALSRPVPACRRPRPRRGPPGRPGRVMKWNSWRRSLVVIALLAPGGCACLPSWKPVAMPGGPVTVRDITTCDSRWYARRLALRPSLRRDEPRRAALDLGARAHHVPVRADSVLSSVACSGRRLVALGAASGGVHGNPRTATWHGDPTGLTEVVAPFELYGGPDAISVDRLAAGPTGFLITGRRLSPRTGLAAAAVWTSPDGGAFTLAAVIDEATTAGAAVPVPDGWSLVGARGATLRTAAAWRSPAGASRSETLSDTATRQPGRHGGGRSVRARTVDEALARSVSWRWRHAGGRRAGSPIRHLEPRSGRHLAGRRRVRLRGRAVDHRPGSGHRRRVRDRLRRHHLPPVAQRERRLVAGDPPPGRAGPAVGGGLFGRPRTPGHRHHPLDPKHLSPTGDPANSCPHTVPSTSARRTDLGS